MRIVLPLIGGVALIALLLWVFLQAAPGKLARWLRIGGGLALIALSGGLLYARQFALAVPLGMAGFMVMRRQAGTRSAGPSGKQSRVSSPGLDMTLDHDTGEMDGQVLVGPHAGRLLSTLSLAELREIAAAFGDDPESSRLLESYLDRTHPGWRDDIHGDPDDRQGAAARPGGMSLHEAYEILGLEQGAGETEVRDAHRRLMKQVHPTGADRPPWPLRSTKPRIAFSVSIAEPQFGTARQEKDLLISLAHAERAWSLSENPAKRAL
jgi:hypothetical protein